MKVIRPHSTEILMDAEASLLPCKIDSLLGLELEEHLNFTETRAEGGGMALGLFSGLSGSAGISGRRQISEPAPKNGGPGSSDSPMLVVAARSATNWGPGPEFCLTDWSMFIDTPLTKEDSAVLGSTKVSSPNKEASEPSVEDVEFEIARTYEAVAEYFLAIEEGEVCPPVTWGVSLEWESTTTIMMRNLPNKYTQAMLLAEINHDGFLGKFDFLYVPIDPETNANRGYAFLNFIDPSFSWMFKLAYEGRKMKRFNSNKVVTVAPAALQGFELNYLHYSSARVNRGDPAARPLFLRDPKLHDLAEADAPKGRRGIRRIIAHDRKIPHMAGPASFESAVPRAPQMASQMVPKYCPSCGIEIQLRFQFCPSCGNMLPFSAQASAFEREE